MERDFLAAVEADDGAATFWEGAVVSLEVRERFAAAGSICTTASLRLRALEVAAGGIDASEGALPLGLVFFLL